jgi:tripartite-type tricarboxylate transporter receptor subunit TctC
MFKRISAAVLAAAGALVLQAPAGAQDYPTKPVTIIVPFTPGGAADGTARIYAEELGKKLGVSFIVDNRPGAGTNIGAEAGANAAPDGYTLFLSNLSSNSLNKWSYANPGYDSDKFEHIAMFGVSSFYLIVNNDSPLKSVKDFIDAAKAKSGGMTYGTSGNGTPGHLAVTLLGKQIGAEFIHIPYKGAAESTADLMAGRLDFMFDGSAINLVRQGKLRALAVGYPERWPGDETIPTMAEAGYPEVTVTTFFGLAAPGGTPKAVIEKLNKAVNEAINGNPELVEKVRKLGTRPLAYTPEEMASFVNGESAKWKPVIEGLGLRF